LKLKTETYWGVYLLTYNLFYIWCKVGEEIRNKNGDKIKFWLWNKFNKQDRYDANCMDKYDIQIYVIGPVCTKKHVQVYRNLLSLNLISNSLSDNHIHKNAKSKYTRITLQNTFSWLNTNITIQLLSRQPGKSKRVTKNFFNKQN
jgi:hypothetical protein